MMYNCRHSALVYLLAKRRRLRKQCHMFLMWLGALNFFDAFRAKVSYHCQICKSLWAQHDEQVQRQGVTWTAHHCWQMHAFVHWAMEKSGSECVVVMECIIGPGCDGPDTMYLRNNQYYCRICLGHACEPDGSVCHAPLLGTFCTASFTNHSDRAVFFYVLHSPFGDRSAAGYNCTPLPIMWQNQFSYLAADAPHRCITDHRLPDFQSLPREGAKPRPAGQSACSNLGQAVMLLPAQ